MNMPRWFQLPVILSVAMHVILLVLVTWGWEASNEHQPKVYRPKFVQATLVELKAQDTAKAAAPDHKVIDLTKERELKKQQGEAERKAREVETRRRQQEKEKQAKADADRKKREAERKRQEQLDAQKRADAERARKESERLQQERAAQQRLDDALRKEEAQAAAELAATQTQSYMNVMIARIEQNWSRPPSARRGMTVTLLINLVPTGQLVNVTVVKSSGNAAFDRSAEQAVRRVDRFTELQNMPPALFEQNFRQVTVLFNPEDLRL